MKQCSCGGVGCKLCKDQQTPRLFLPVEPMGAVRTTQKQKYVDERAKRYHKYKQDIQMLTLSRIKGVPKGKGVVVTDLIFYLPIPKSGKTTIMKDGKRKTIKLSDNMAHIQKPDVDNLVKGLFDALNGYAWADDNQICEITSVKKVYSDMPGIEFGIEFFDL